MAPSDTVDADDLREWLDHVESRAAAELLVFGIAHDQGLSASDLTNWFGRDMEEIEDALESLRTEALSVAIARREGVDFERIAEASGLNRRTVIDWFASLDQRPTSVAADVVRRYASGTRQPLLSGTKSRIVYVNYEAIDERGWSIEDEDLFEKAAEADLPLSEHGRFMANPGETILEAAERCGRDWPFACRGGACANCAVLVKSGDVAMPGQSVLTSEQIQSMNARLTCIGVPVTDEVRLVMNVQHLEEFEDLLLPSPMADTEPSI